MYGHVFGLVNALTSIDVDSEKNMAIVIEAFERLTSPILHNTGIVIRWFTDYPLKASRPFFFDMLLHNLQNETQHIFYAQRVSHLFINRIQQSIDLQQILKIPFHQSFELLINYFAYFCIRLCRTPKTKKLTDELIKKLITFDCHYFKDIALTMVKYSNWDIFEKESFVKQHQDIQKAKEILKDLSPQFIDEHDWRIFPLSYSKLNQTLYSSESQDDFTQQINALIEASASGQLHHVFCKITAELGSDKTTLLITRTIIEIQGLCRKHRSPSPVEKLWSTLIKPLWELRVLGKPFKFTEKEKLAFMRTRYLKEEQFKESLILVCTPPYIENFSEEINDFLDILLEFPKNIDCYPSEVLGALNFIFTHLRKIQKFEQTEKGFDCSVITEQTVTSLLDALINHPTVIQNSKEAAQLRYLANNMAKLGVRIPKEQWLQIKNISLI